MEKPLENNVAEYSVGDVANREDHAELINGNLVVEAKTTAAHNNAVLEIATALRHFTTANNGICKVFTENVALYCNELSEDAKNLFLPDVMTVCDKEGIKDDGVHTAPLFVAEVTSESARKNDYGRKMITYGEIGVKEYWVVDLQKKVVFQYLKSDDYIPQFFIHPESLGVSVFPGLNICLECMRTPKK